MKEASILPILRSDTQARVLTRLVLNPGVELSLTELAKVVEASVPTVLREVDRAERAGLLRSRRAGNLRLVSADPSSPLFEAIAELLLKSFGLPQVIRDEFGPIAGREAVFIFGSWAARFRGEPGPSPRDVDVLVLGAVDRDDAFEAAARAERRLGRPVNVTVRPAQWWREGVDPFLQRLRDRPLVPVTSEEDRSE